LVSNPNLLNNWFISSLLKAPDKFLISFFLGCLNAIFKNFSNFSSSCDELLSINSTAEVTLGGGTNASASTSKHRVASPTFDAKTLREENSRSPTLAENFNATSFCTITNIDWQYSSLNAFNIILVAI